MRALIWIAIATAEGIEDYFPEQPLAPSAVAEASAALLGAGATVYDSTTASPGAASLDEAKIEAALFKGLRPAPDSLRAWGRYMLKMLSKGPVPSNYRWFSAEHLGLPVLPFVATWFWHPRLDSIPANVRGFLADADDLSTAAVVIEPHDGGYRGIIVGISGNATFEPFPRVWHAGDVASVPGTLLNRRDAYQLYVTGVGPEVKTYELPREQGQFDVDVPLPAVAGTYRVAMDAYRPNSFPDSRFFFSLYVDTPVPTAASAFAETTAVGDEESQYLALLNDARAKEGLAPLERVGKSETLRAFLAALPKSEGANVRAWRQFGRVDPLPDIEHGTWRGVGASGTVEQAAWESVENPVNRLALFSPTAKFA